MLTLIYFITSDNAASDWAAWKSIQVKVEAEAVPEMQTQIRLPEIDKTANVESHERNWKEPNVVTVFLGIQNGLTEDEVVVLETSGWKVDT